MNPFELAALIKADISRQKKQYRKYVYRITACLIPHHTEPTSNFNVLLTRAIRLLSKLHKKNHITTDKLVTELANLKHFIAELTKK